MEKYVHQVRYYETDRMGITHHSNYVRWMEEARIDFLDQIGLSYKKLEDAGILSPVVALSCEYTAPTTFDDRVEITVSVLEFRGVKLVLGYTMCNAEDGKTVMRGKSTHCFADRSGRPIALKRRFPELDAALRALVGADAPSETEEQEAGA